MPDSPAKDPGDRTSSGAIEYRFIDGEGKPYTLLDEQMMHTRGVGTARMFGLSPVSMGRNVFGAAMAADESASKMFATGMKLGGVLSTDQTLNKVQREDSRTGAAGFGGSNRKSCGVANSQCNG